MSVRCVRGFTLLELLLSLTMLAVMVVIVFGTFRIGVRAWEKGESGVETRHRQRIVLEQMRRQMASTSTRLLLENGQTPFFPEGSGRKLRFVSEVPLLHSNAFGLVYVEYRVESGGDDLLALKVFEKNLVFLEKDFLESEPDEEEFVEFLTGLKDVSFSYRTRPEEGQEGEWQEEWRPDDEKKFPRAVKLTLTPAESASALVVIAGIEWEEGR